jgi:hypothetical protein
VSFEEPYADDVVVEQIVRIRTCPAGIVRQLRLVLAGELSAAFVVVEHRTSFGSERLGSLRWFESASLPLARRLGKPDTSRPACGW